MARRGAVTALGVLLGAAFIGWRYVKDDVTPWVTETADKVGSFFSSVGNVMLSNILPNAAIGAGLAGVYYGGKAIARKAYDHIHRKNIKNMAVEHSESNLAIPNRIKEEKKKAEKLLSNIYAPDKKIELKHYDRPSKMKKNIEGTLEFFKKEKEFILQKHEETAHMQNVQSLLVLQQKQTERESKFISSLSPKNTSRYLYDLPKVRYNMTLERMKEDYKIKVNGIEAEQQKTTTYVEDSQDFLKKELALLNEEQNKFGEFVRIFGKDTKIGPVLNGFKEEIDGALAPLTQEDLNQRHYPVFNRL